MLATIAPNAQPTIINQANDTIGLTPVRDIPKYTTNISHKGVEYTVAVTAVPSIWRWQFQIGQTVKTGKTETKINLLPIHRVQLRIDRELKKTTYNPP